MGTLLALVARDAVRFLRNPSRVLLTLAVPLALAGIFSLVFGGGGVDPRIRVLLWDQDDTGIGTLLAQGMRGGDGAERLEVVLVGEEGLAMMQRGEATALVRIPLGFLDRYLAGEPVALEVVKNPAERFLPRLVHEGVQAGAVVLSQLSRVVGPELRDFGTMLDGERTPTTLEIGAFAERVATRVEAVGRSVFPPVITIATAPDESADASADGESDGQAAAAKAPASSPLDALFPGLAVLGALFVAQSAAREFHAERASGVLRRTLAGPVTIGTYVLSKTVSTFVMTMAGLAILVSAGWALGVRWGSVPGIALVLVVTALAASGLLVLLSAITKTERHFEAVAIVVVMVSSMLGGAFFPTSAFPSFLQPLTRATVGYWAGQGLAAFGARGPGFAAAATPVAVLAFAGLALTLAGAVLLGCKLAREGA